MKALILALGLPGIFGDHMVLQQNRRNPVWGWDSPGASVTVAYGSDSQSTRADSQGRWRVELPPLPASWEGRDLLVKGSSEKRIRDVVVGEVWLCSGQSNMEFALQRETNGVLEIAAARTSRLRLMKVAHLGTQAAQSDISGSWAVADPESARRFSAVAYYYGEYLERVLDVPVGLIDTSWGGASIEAFLPRAKLEKDPQLAVLMGQTHRREAAPAGENADPVYLRGRNRPGNIYAGMIHPLIGYGIRGVIWYQGEQNVGKPAEYRAMFPLLITDWRSEWGEGDFPFYWVQLPRFHAQAVVSDHSNWADLREAQASALTLPHTGQAVAVDLGEGKDIHPRDKREVAARLARWALAKDYGVQLPYRSPELKRVAIAGNRVFVTLECYGAKLRPFGVTDVLGFAVCGEDRVWHAARGAVRGRDTVELQCGDVPHPRWVRYAWADNPICNLYSEDGLPVTPFRTDP